MFKQRTHYKFKHIFFSNNSLTYFHIHQYEEEKSACFTNKIYFLEKKLVADCMFFLSFDSVLTQMNPSPVGNLLPTSKPKSPRLHLNFLTTKMENVVMLSPGARSFNMIPRELISKSFFPSKPQRFASSVSHTSTAN